MATSQRRLHLLSLDGGGIRCLSSISILKHIMKGINADRQVGDKLQPWEGFDMIGGTSTGGLIAVMIGRLRMTLDQCEEAYLDLGKRIFQRKYNPVDIPHRLKNFWDAGEKFSGEELEAAVKEIITKGGHLPEDAPLKDDDPACKVFVCTVQASDSKAHALRSYETKIYYAQYPFCKIWEACRATSAATTFFDPIEIGSKRVKYIDGGIKSNNPISMVHFEASMIWPNRINDALVISIGTGSAPGPKFEGNIASIIKALREIVTVSDDAANAFEDAHESMARSDLYFRFTVHQKLADIGLEEWDATGDVEAATASYMTLAETRRKCDRCIQKIIATRTSYSSEEQNCLYSLCTVNPGDFRTMLAHHKETRVESTCTWLLSHVSYIKWLVPSSSLLWISGAPGQGKTMLALFMTKELEHMSEKKEKTTVGYFFWDVRTRQNTAAAMLRTLIYQLLRKQTQLFVHIMDDYLMRKSSDLPPFSDESFTILWRIFSAMINNESHDTFYCVLDGLDECEKTSRDLFLDLLHQLLHANHGNESSRRKLKLLVTSRPLPGNTELKFTPFGLQLELNKATSGHDVQLYIKKQVADLVNLGFSEARVARIEKTLSSRCESTFLWVSLATQEMKKKPPWKAEKLVAKLPSGMGKLYAKLLASINTEFRTDVEHILMLVSTAFRPLTVMELTTAHWLSRPPKATSLPDEESLREINVYLGHCSSFLRYEETTKGEQTAHLCHSILMDCINVNPGRSHLQVFTTLIRNLHLDDMGDVKLECFPIGVSFNGKILFSVQIKEGIHSELKDETKIRKPQANALRHYACDFWSQHSVQCSELLRFSENKSWRWPWPPEFFFVASDRRIRNTHESIKAMKEDQSKWSICRAMSTRSHTIQTPEHMFIIASSSGCLPFVEYYTRTHLHSTSVERISVKLLLAEALLEATEFGRTPIVDFLLKNGADVYATPNFRFENLDQQPPFRNLIPTKERHYGKTPLHYASQNGDLNVATLLLAAKSDVKLQDVVGFTPLHWAVVTENFEMTELLLDHGSDAEIKDNKGASPLHYAAGYGKIQYPIVSEKNREIICGYLLDRGAVGRDKNTESLTPLVCAIMCNLHGVVEILLETGAYDIHEPPLPTEMETSEIHMAASSQQYDLVYKLLLKGMSLSTLDIEGKTPLLVAAEVGDVEMVKLLLELGSDISAQDRHGRTALHLAAAGFYELPTRLEEGRFDVVRFLAETNRSLLEIEDDEGNLPEDHALTSFDQEYTENVDFDWGTSVMTAADEIGDRGAALRTHDWLEEQRLLYNSEP